jgi:predicted Na+-dependent transporter
LDLQLLVFWDISFHVCLPSYLCEGSRRVADAGSTAVAQHGGVIRSEYSILYGAVAFIFIVSGLQLSPEKLRKNVTNWRLHILVHGISFAVIPAIVLGKFTLFIALCLMNKEKTKIRLES